MFLHSTAVLLGRPCTYDALPPLPSLPVHLRCSATALTVGWALWTTALAAPAASVRCGADVQKWESLLGGVPDPHNQQPASVSGGRGQQSCCIQLLALLGGFLVGSTLMLLDWGAS
jgi:hypothetical protein